MSRPNAIMRQRRPPRFLHLFLCSTIFIAGAVSLPHRAGGMWASFCDDEDCSVNCGIDVSLDNAGCLQQSGRRSIHLHGGTRNLNTNYRLILSETLKCPCQADCLDFWSFQTDRHLEEPELQPTFDGWTESTTAKCLPIPRNWNNMQSLRFVAGHCHNDTCI